MLFVLRLAIIPVKLIEIRRYGVNEYENIISSAK